MEVKEKSGLGGGLQKCLKIEKGQGRGKQVANRVNIPKLNGNVWIYPFEWILLFPIMIQYCARCWRQNSGQKGLYLFKAYKSCRPPT